ncbi:MAG: hypothetical protein QMC67_08000 [Candidatus Wallbacteria bacterium]
MKFINYVTSCINFDKKILASILIAPISALVISDLPAANAAETQNKQVSQAKINVSVKYGAKDNEISPRVINEAKSSIMPNPGCFALDSSENIFVADELGQKILKITKGGSTKECVLKYNKAPIYNNFISDIAISNSGFVYLADAESNKIHKFDDNGNLINTLGQTKDGKPIIKKIKNIFTDNKSNLIAIDMLEPKAVVFDESGALTKEVKLPISDVSFSYAYCTNSQDKIYVTALEPNRFRIANAEKTDEIILNYSHESKNGKDRIVDGKLIGFDAKDNVYVRIVLANEDGAVSQNWIMKFSNDAKLLKKIAVPYYDVDEQPLILAEQCFVLKEDVIMTYKEEEKTFDFITYELK